MAEAVDPAAPAPAPTLASVASLWAELQARGEVQGALPEHTAAPWYVTLMLGLAGWLGAFFLLGFFLSTVFAVSDGAAPVMGLTGVMLVAVARLLLARGAARQAAAQFALATSLCGQGLMAHALARVMEPGWNASGTLYLLLMAAIALALLLLVDDAAHRFLTALGFWVAAGLAWLMLFEPRTLLLQGPALHGPLAAALAVMVAATQAEPAAAARGRHRLLMPFASAAALVAAATSLGVTALGSGLVDPDASWRRAAATQIGGAGLVVALAAAGWAVHETRRVLPGRRPMALAAALVAALGLVLLQAPAAGCGLLITACAHRRRSRAWLVLGLLTTLAGFGAYYAGLGWTLLAKSVGLVALGALLLAAGAWLGRRGVPTGPRTGTPHDAA